MFFLIYTYGAYGGGISNNVPDTSLHSPIAAFKKKSYSMLLVPATTLAHGPLQKTQRKPKGPLAQNTSSRPSTARERPRPMTPSISANANGNGGSSAEPSSQAAKPLSCPRLLRAAHGADCRGKQPLASHSFLKNSNSGTHSRQGRTEELH